MRWGLPVALLVLVPLLTSGNAQAEFRYAYHALQLWQDAG
jgi:hypothetical protein